MVDWEFDPHTIVLKNTKVLINKWKQILQKFKKFEAKTLIKSGLNNNEICYKFDIYFIY